MNTPVPSKTSLLVGGPSWLLVLRSYVLFQFFVLLGMNIIPFGLAFYGYATSLSSTLLYIEFGELGRWGCLIGLPILFALLMHFPRLIGRAPVVQFWPFGLFIVLWILSFLYIVNDLGGATAYDGWAYILTVFVLQFLLLFLACAHWLIARRAPESIAASVYRYSAIVWLLYLAFPTVN